MSHLSQRPEVDPSVMAVGAAIPHEAAALHVTGQALYTDDLVVRTKDCLHAWPVQATVAKARITGLDVAPAYDVPGVVRVLTADDVPGVNDAGVKHDEPLFPDEVRFYGHACAGCWARPSRRPGSVPRPWCVDLEPLPALINVKEAIAAHAFQGAQPTVERGDVAAGIEAATHVFSGEFEFAGQEHFYLETHCALAHVDEGGQVFVQSSTQHPSETQEIVAHVLGLHSHEVTVQCLRMGGGFGGKEMQPHGFAAIASLGSHPDRPPGPAPPQPDPGPHHEREAARVPRRVAGGLRRRRPDPGPRGDADRGRRLEPGPLRAGAGPGALPHRQRLLGAPHQGERPDREDQQDLADGLPWLRWAAGDDRDRGHPRPLRAAARDRPGGAAPAQLLPLTRRHPADHPLRPAGPPSRASRGGLGRGHRVRPTSAPARRRSGGSTPSTRT